MPVARGRVRWHGPGTCCGKAKRLFLGLLEYDRPVVAVSGESIHDPVYGGLSMGVQVTAAAKFTEPGGQEEALASDSFEVVSD